MLLAWRITADDKADTAKEDTELFQQASWLNRFQ